MADVISSRWTLRNDPLGFGATSLGRKAPSDDDFQTEFGEVLGPVSANDLTTLKLGYTALILHLDRLRPQLGSSRAISRGPNGSWSVKEILGHILDADTEIWWPRIEAILRQFRPQFTVVDEQELMRRKDWQSLALEDIFAQLVRTRWRYGLALNAIATEDFERTGEHPVLGVISILRILQILVAHDAHYLDLIRSMVEDTPNSDSGV